MHTRNTDLIHQNKIFIWLAVSTGIILAIPLVAMQFTSEVDWSLADFILMGILIFGTGLAYIAVARVVPDKYRLILGLSFLFALLLIWVHLAVGIVDTWPLAGS